MAVLRCKVPSRPQPRRASAFGEGGQVAVQIASDKDWTDMSRPLLVSVHQTSSASNLDPLHWHQGAK